MQINGEQCTPDGKTVTEIIEERDLKKEMVAVELNEKILSKEQYHTYVPQDNNIIEIVQFMGRAHY